MDAKAWNGEPDRADDPGTVDDPCCPDCGAAPDKRCTRECECNHCGRLRDEAIDRKIDERRERRRRMDELMARR